MALRDRLKFHSERVATATIATIATGPEDNNFLVADVADVADVATETDKKTTKLTSPISMLCEECSRVEVLTIAGEAVPGCLYQAEGEFSDGWRRIPAGTARCIWGSVGKGRQASVHMADIDKETRR